MYSVSLYDDLCTVSHCMMMYVLCLTVWWCMYCVSMYDDVCTVSHCMMMYVQCLTVDDSHFSLSGFIRGLSGEIAHQICFQPRFLEGALLTVVSLWFDSIIQHLGGGLHGLVGRALDHRSLPPELKARHGHIWRVFHLWLPSLPF